MKLQRRPTRWHKIKTASGNAWQRFVIGTAFRLLGKKGQPYVTIEANEVTGFKTNIPYLDVTLTGNITLTKESVWSHELGTLILHAPSATFNAKEVRGIDDIIPTPTMTDIQRSVKELTDKFEALYRVLYENNLLDDQFSLGMVGGENGDEYLEFIARIRHLCWCSFQMGADQPYNIEPTPDQWESLIDGVQFLEQNHAVTTEMSHENWLKKKTAQGWKYGKYKCPTCKTHPDMVSFDELPLIERMKDHLAIITHREAEKLWNNIGRSRRRQATSNGGPTVMGGPGALPTPLDLKAYDAALRDLMKRCSHPIEKRSTYMAEHCCQCGKMLRTWPAPESGVEPPNLVLKIWAVDGKVDEWEMSDPSNPGRAFGGIDIEWVKFAVSPDGMKAEGADKLVASPKPTDENICTVCGEIDCKRPVEYDDEGPFHWEDDTDHLSAHEIDQANEAERAAEEIAKKEGF